LGEYPELPRKSQWLAKIRKKNQIFFKKYKFDSIASSSSLAAAFHATRYFRLLLAQQLRRRLLRRCLLLRQLGWRDCGLVSTAGMRRHVAAEQAAWSARGPSSLRLSKTPN
jgi:hypothetical protein